MFGLNLRDYTKLFSRYTELRLQENRVVRIAFVKGNNTLNSRSITSGISARVNSNGSWGFASNPEISRQTTKSVIKTATDNAIFLDSREQKAKKELPDSPFFSENDFSTKKTRLKQKQLVEFIKQLDDNINSKYPNLLSRTVSLNLLDMEKNLLTSDGSYSYSMIPRSTIGISMSLIKDGQPVEFSKAYGGLGHFEDLFETPEDLYERVEEQYYHLENKTNGVFAKAGIKTCVLDAELAGILAHEAIGHTTEADMVMSGSVARGKIGKRVASPLVTLVDFAHTYNGQTLPVPVHVDDEGSKAEDTVIIEKGILKNYMHNKETAQHFGVAPTGNARAYQFSDEPLIRMRNTAILPGTSRLEDMIESIEDGYYLIYPSNGQADSTSEFMFGITLGYEIKNGKIGKAIKDTTISGVAFDMLKTVTMISGDMEWSNSGMCGKKQLIPVGMGGPAIKCNVNIGGR